MTIKQNSMNHDDFKKLVQNSPVYKTLSADMKKQILGSTGEERLNYEHIFNVESEGIRTAKQQFVDRNQEVIREFNGEVKAVQKQKFQDEESEAQREEEATTKTLLKDLDNV